MKFEGLTRDALVLVGKILGIVVVSLLFFTFVYGLMQSREPCMAPHVKDGDLVIFYRFAKKEYMPRDLVVVNEGGRKTVRRIVATGGDVVDISESGLVINGALQQEPGIRSHTYRYQEGINFPLTVPRGEVFVLADERAGAEDSRIYGTVRREDLAGKVMTILRRREF